MDGSGSGPSRHLAWRDCGKLRRTLLMMKGVLAEIRTGLLSNTCQNVVPRAKLFTVYSDWLPLLTNLKNCEQTVLLVSGI
jgi:hypothetical protein